MKSFTKMMSQYGGSENVIVFLLLCILLFFITSTVKNKRANLIINIVGSFILSAQIFALYSTQRFVSYQFYVHMNLREISGMNTLFLLQTTILLIFFIVLMILNFNSQRIWNKVEIQLGNKKIAKAIPIITCLFIIFAIMSHNNFVRDSKELLSIISFSNKTDDFEEVLKRNNMSDYTLPDDIKSSKGKNIIVLSMESIERGFLSEKFSSITPNLNRLREEWNYFDVKQNIGSGWTSGSLYTSLTGFPAYFGVRGNDIFESAYHTNISGISHALGNANYTTVYLNGNTDYSDVNVMLNVFGFEKIIDYKNAPIAGNQSRYGLRDKDLFLNAQNELDQLIEKDKPFALFVSTTDTHFPNGIYDERMEFDVSPKNSNLEFSIASLDHLLGNFITYLKSKNILENTIIYLFPDHLKMGDPTILNDTGERSLYIITNADKRDIKIDDTKEIFQIDLPKIILSGAKINHNLKFLTDYIVGDKDQFIRDNINNITEINRIGLTRLNDKNYIRPKVSKFYSEYKRDTLRYIAHAGGAINGHIYTNSLEALDFNYKKGFRLFELDIMKSSDGKYIALHDWQTWKQMTGYKGKTPILHKDFMKFKLLNNYSPLSIDEINDWFKNHPDAILVTDKVNEPASFSKVFFDKDRLMMELFTIDAVNKGLDIGLLSSIPSQSVIKKLDVPTMEKMGVKHAVVSRFFIESNKAFLEKLKLMGIKVYVYNVNQDGGVVDSGIDEDYVTKYELDYVYGMYADRWNFE